VWLVLALVVVAALVGMRRAARTAGPAARLSRRQRWCFVGGVLALAVATTWPLGDLAAHWSLTALVVQRLLLTLVAAPLLLMATPSALWAALTRPAPVDAVLRVTTRPVVAVAVFSAIVLSTLLVPCVDAQSSSAGWRALIDGWLVVAGVVLWAPAMRHLPGVERTGPVGVAVYLFVQSIVPTFLAVVYVFAHRPFYSAFAHVHRAFSMSPLVDQQVAGVVGKVGTLPVLWSAAWMSLARAQRAEDETSPDDPLTWVDVERELERAARAEKRRVHPSALRVRWDGRRTPRAAVSPGHGDDNRHGDDRTGRPSPTEPGSSGGA
jgi:cytochrome c oxidase assembly factor CtaG